ncbi:hypothetical protein FRC04_007227 [Tulasnella sp. 424]|nr:hypothetical protein FRC04_007227 [Tulasnella sp. 424]
MRAHLLFLQNQVKACRATLKREINVLNAVDSSSAVYTCYFTNTTALLSSTTAQPPDYSNALSTLKKSSRSRTVGVTSKSQLWLWRPVSKC